jgi:hypothetical protein
LLAASSTVYPWLVLKISIAIMATTDALPAVVESNATFDDNADAPLTVNAAALNLTKEQMIAFMNLVRHASTCSHGLPTQAIVVVWHR